MSGSAFQSEAILASAGFGKTYQLAHRYIKLLACGCSPHQICAVTFSRKAGGEIFDSIVKYLLQAATDPKKAKGTASEIDMPELTTNDFKSILKRFLADLHRNHIGTLDSFTVSVARAFPLELGISPNLQLMDNTGSSARLVRHQVFARIFNHNCVKDHDRESFHEAFKQATFGKEEKNFVKVLDQFIEQYWERFQALPDADSWGNIDLIWPDGCPWLDPSNPTKEAANKLQELVNNRDFPHGSIAKGMSKSIRLLAEHNINKPWNTKDVNKFMSTLLRTPNILNLDSLTVKFHKEFTLNKEELGLWCVLLKNLVGTEIQRAIEQSSGIGRILEQYEKLYDPIRRSGRMTFSDAQYLLTPANTWSGGELASRNAEKRLYIDYRLDCALDHWLIDEFQDTSDLQWEVIQNLIEEIVQEDDGTRSFFYVGDVKQAVHGWRGGNAKLFEKILARYNIPLRMPDKSHRSCKPVLDAVNLVFEALPEQIPEKVQEIWQRVWIKHEPEPTSVPSSGCTALIAANPTGKKGKCTEEDRFHAVANLLNDINPAEKGLSTAVLVRSNDAGKKLVNQLRHECNPDISICHEGRARIVDNPVVRVLLSLIKFAAHPGDSLAWRHIQMSPFGQHLADSSISKETLPVILLEEIYLHGFEPFIRKWGQKLELKTDDRFGLKRIDDLASAAAAFDADGSRDCGMFLDYVADHEVIESGTQNTINVMTIHKSKGLTFDIVIMPELERGESERVPYFMERDQETNHSLWSMILPNKDIANADDVLADIRDKHLDNGRFENLCVLYVGMTRARYATYMIVDPKSSETSPASLLRDQLCRENNQSKPITLNNEQFTCLYENGEEKWHESIESVDKPSVEPQKEIKRDYSDRQSTRRRLVSIEPSTEKVYKQKASKLFQTETLEIMNFGLAVHELLEQVEWTENADIDNIASSWESTSAYNPEVTRDVIEQFRNCMTDADIIRHLSKPEGNIELWREKQFSIVKDNEIISGAFDRVTITRDDNGKVTSASIIDYKSSMVETEEKINDKVTDYSPQMLAYRDALSIILNIPEEKIALQLLFTKQNVIKTV